MLSSHVVLDKNNKPVKTTASLHPGEVLAEELEVRNISKKDFAAAVNMHAAHFSDLLKGRRHISAKLAIRLEEQLKIDAALWLRLQSAYDLALARKELQML